MPESTSPLGTTLVADGMKTNLNGGVYTIPFAQTLANLGTSAADVITGFVPGHRFKILGLSFRTGTAGTGSGATQALNLEIGTTDVTGGVLTLTLANQQTTYGQIVNATAITDLNEGSATDAISLKLAASGTAFSAGAGDILLRIQNLEG